MKKGGMTIGAGLLFCLLLSLTLGIGNQQLPYLAAKYGGSSGYLGFILAYVLIMLIVFVALYFQKRYPKKSFIEYTQLVLGNVLGKILSCLFLSFILLLLVWAIRSTAETMDLYFLQRTPLWVIMVLFFLSITYLALQGIEGITKTCAFFLPMAFIFMALIVFVSYQNFDFDKIKPVFHVHQGTFLSAIHLFSAFFPLSILFIVLPFLTDIKRSQAISVKATLLGTAILFFFIVASMGAYGAKGLLRYGWPTTELPRITNIPYLLQTFGFFYTVTWLSQMYIGAGACYYAAAQGFTLLFSRFNYKWFILILWPPTFFLAWILPGVIELRIFFDYFRIIGFIILFILPLLLWVVDRSKPGRRDAYD
ncbi:MAG: GerAB/ArcD/ProY family transporter [Bacillota bacterium]